MALFQYKARNSRGDAVQGQLEAANADAVATQLLNSGIIPIDIREQELAPPGAWTMFKRRFMTAEIGLDDLLLFCRQMYALTKSGVPLVRGVTGLSETTRCEALANALRAIRNDLEAGRDLSSSMSFHPRLFAPLVVSMVRVGENTGRLDLAFQQLAQYLELDRDTRDRVKMAIRYPTFVLLAIAAAIVVVNVWVIPAFADVFAKLNAQLPWQTRLLMAVSSFFVTFWPLLLIAAVGAFVFLRSYIRTEQGRYAWDRLKLRIPVAGDIIHRATLARFARAFAITFGSGVPLVQSLTVVSRAVDNEFIAERIVAMRGGVERGDTLFRTATATGMFTPLVLQMIALGEETGAIDRMMEEVAGFYEREVDYDIKNLSSAIEPILIIAVGVLVLILALGIFLPMWDLGRAALH